MRHSRRHTIGSGLGLFLVALSGCSGPPIIPGLRPYDRGAIAESTGNLSRDVALLEQSVGALAAAAVDVQAGRSAAAAEEMAKVLVRLGPYFPSPTIGGTYKYYHLSSSSSRPNLFQYPRITCPALIEPHCIAGKGEWIVPIVLNTLALDWHRHNAAELVWGLGLTELFFSEPDYQTADGIHELQEELFFCLVPHGIDLPQPARCVALRQFAKLPGTVALENGDSFCFLGARPGSVPMAFAIGESMASAGGEVPGDQNTLLETAAPGYYDVRIFPRLRSLASPRPDELFPAALGQLRRCLATGEWPRVPALVVALKREIKNFLEASPRYEQCEAVVGKGLRDMANAIDDLKSGCCYFREDLLGMRDALYELSCLLTPTPSSGHWGWQRHVGECPGTVTATDFDREWRERWKTLETAVTDYLRADGCPAPVSLEGPSSGQSFSFVVGADLQYDFDISHLRRFFAVLDPISAPNGPPHDGGPLWLTDELRREASRAKFVLLVGDLGDGRGVSSSGFNVFVNSLGMDAPTSPYASGSGRSGEFPELREEFRHFAKPVFAVPGNHDGFVNYGGIANQALRDAGVTLRLLPLLPIFGRALDYIARRFPTLVRFSILPSGIETPFTDGLIDWTDCLGPLNVAFDYRGQAFLGLNSFDLESRERDQVGPVANNWGGGMRDESVIWAGVMMDHLGRRAQSQCKALELHNTFLFMHHDPRGAISSTHSYHEENFGYYDEIYAPGNELTLGYGGLGWSSRFGGLYFPIISPLSDKISRYLVEPEGFQQAWMKEGFWDDACYHAKDLVRLINANLYTRSRRDDDGVNIPARGGISHIFFAHDDVPTVSQWVHAEWGNAILPRRDEQNSPLELLFRTRSKRLPKWAKEMPTPDGNAMVVRLDDLGDLTDHVPAHGFCLVHVWYRQDAVTYERWLKQHHAGATASANDPWPRVTVTWVPIPR